MVEHPEHVCLLLSLYQQESRVCEIILHLLHLCVDPVTDTHTHTYFMQTHSHTLQLMGAPKPKPLREVAVMYLLFVVEKGVFC